MATPTIIAETTNYVSLPASLLPPREVCLGSVEGISPGQGRAYRVGEESVAVFRQRSGKLNAIQNTCPHRGGPLSEGILGAGTVICPYHAWRFQLATGECLSDPCVLKTYPVREENGQIYLGVTAGSP